MREIDSIILDLDGTLWDTCASCAIGWNNVLQNLSIPFRTVTPEDVRKVTGKPHQACIRQTFSGLTENQLQALIEETAKEDTRIVAEMGGELYDGVKEGLKELAGRYGLFIVSNCQKGYIEAFLQWADVKDLFSDFECWGNTGLSKTANLKSLIKRNLLQQPMYVGDMAGDQLAASEADIPFAFVEHGFGKCENCDLSFPNFPALVSAFTGEILFMGSPI